MLYPRSFIQFDHARRVAFMKADTAFAAGQQVFESYGNKSNYEYLLYNGFVMPDNPNQCVFVEFPDPERPHGAAASLCVSDTNVPPRVRRPLRIPAPPRGSTAQTQQASDLNRARAVSAPEGAGLGQ